MTPGSAAVTGPDIRKTRVRFSTTTTPYPDGGIGSPGFRLLKDENVNPNDVPLDDDDYLIYRGADIVQENLRQLCVHHVAEEMAQPWLWWDYASIFAERCAILSWSSNLLKSS